MEMLLHVSRPVRWDSDHVVALDDELLAICQEIVRGQYDYRMNVALDYFDASINRIAAWVIGCRNTQKAMLRAYLEPVELLKKAELDGDLTSRLALGEELKFYPFNAVWDYYCEISNVPVREKWLAEVKKYEADVLSKRV
jgi:L-rhamnose isomerase